MNKLLLFTDGSVNTQSKIGYGAYLAIIEDEISQDLDVLKTKVKVKSFENTSSSKLELQTLLWALNDVQIRDNKIIIYTDSQNIMGLPGRRERFEKNDYRTKNNRRISNFELYSEFYRIADLLDFEFVKVHGHMVSKQKDTIDRLFTLVDRASRKTLRKNNG
ncbi:MAG: hypothetical protein JXJ22_18835 [Bacteroidales bacterium]|nr:hypothetical protein [Bacteroidales bacterium]